MEYNEPTSEGGQRRYVLARNRGGQREHLVLLEAELFHRFNEDSLDSGELHWSTARLDSEVPCEAPPPPPDNTIESDTAEEDPQFHVNVQSPTSFITSLYDGSALDSYKEETAASPELRQTENVPGPVINKKLNLAAAMNGSLLNSVAETSPPAMSPLLVPITAVTPVKFSLSKVEARRRSKSEGDQTSEMEVDPQVTPAKTGVKRDRSKADLSGSSLAQSGNNGAAASLSSLVELVEIPHHLQRLRPLPSRKIPPPPKKKNKS